MVLATFCVPSVVATACAAQISLLEGQPLTRTSSASARVNAETTLLLPAARQ